MWRGPSPASVESPGRQAELFRSIDHQLAARSVAFLRGFVEGHDNPFLASPGFLHQSVGDALCDLALLIGGMAGRHCDLNYWHDEFSEREGKMPSRLPPRRRSYDYFDNSYPAKKKLSSKRAVSSASEPWIALCSMLVAHFLRMVPSSAFAGFVAPINLRRSAMAFSFSSASTTIGPLDMKSVSVRKNGRLAWTA